MLSTFHIMISLLAGWKFTPTVMEFKAWGTRAFASQSLHVGTFFVSGAAASLGWTRALPWYDSCWCKREKKRSQRKLNIFFIVTHLSDFSHLSYPKRHYFHQLSRADTSCNVVHSQEYSLLEMEALARKSSASRFSPNFDIPSLPNNLFVSDLRRCLSLFLWCGHTPEF